MMTQNKFLIPILALGVFGILNTEMGVVGIIPIIAERFQVSVPDAAWMVSLFALVVAFSAPITPLLFSKINRKTAMVLALSVFVLSNLVSIFVESYAVQLIARAVPAFFHPVYVTIAFTVAAMSVVKEEAPKAVSKVFVGVSAGMVLGVPMTSFIADSLSFQAAMIFFASVNIIVLFATLKFVPSLPVAQNLTYGDQFNVLKKPILWISILSAILMNAVMFGFYSYLSDYLQSVTQVSFKIISILLFVYGMTNILGNILAGKMLAKTPQTTLKIIPLILTALYVALFISGESLIVVAIILFALGMIVGIANNGNQYLVSSAAPEAPEFANGLFLTAANLGTTLGTFICGLFIAGWDNQASVLGAIMFALLGFVGIWIRNRVYQGMLVKV
ncbi:arabinose ABC transporter permease [Rodentibacter mrazii]|uniref:Arabinose ABC transporter permease n=1 Tax=Rodentibacter mrazii TaxID=1908257 RepID=A0A1V3III6_9PAST|nr:MFS transporter [Rodentibacter mrazii]OOF40777.1 arabinose ABC transporter permease [Rodentibacter mrazii]